MTKFDMFHIKAKTLRCFLCAVLLVIFLFSLAPAALAVSTADAKDPLDPAKPCSLTMKCSDSDGHPEGGLDIEIFHVATLSASGEFSLCGSFLGYPVNVKNIASSTEWKAVTDTIGAYIVADGIAPDFSGTTDAGGSAVFPSLLQGLYYVRVKPGTFEIFAPYILSVPTLSDDLLWVYDVISFPKPEPAPIGGGDDDEENFKVIKLWKDDGSAERPAEITVDIFRDGSLYKSIVLNEGNHWTYAWTAYEKHTWTAVEHDVPEGYEVTVEVQKTTFVITNSKPDAPPPIDAPDVPPDAPPDEPPSGPDSPSSDGPWSPLPGTGPKTGDSSHLALYIVLEILSGILLITLGVIGRRRWHE